MEQINNNKQRDNDVEGIGEVGDDLINYSDKADIKMIKNKKVIVKKNKKGGKTLPNCNRVQRWQDAPLADTTGSSNLASNDVRLIQASPNSDVNCEPEINEYISEEEINNEHFENINNVVNNDFLDTFSSEGSDATRLDSDDEKIFIHRQNKKTLSSCVVSDNSARDQELLYVMCENIGRRMQEIKEQNDILIQDKQSVIENNKAYTEKILNEKCATLQENVTKAINQVQLGINESMHETIILKEDIARGHEGIRNDLDSVQNSLKNDIQGVQTQVKNDIQGVQTQVKNDIQGVQAQVKNDIQSVQDQVQGVQDNVNELKVSFESRILAQSENLATVSTNVLAAVTSVEGQVQTVGLRLEEYKYETDITKLDITQLKSDMLEEIETRVEQVTKVNIRVDTLEEKLEESRVENLAVEANKSIQVMALESQVNSLLRKVNELQKKQDQYDVKVDRLEGEIKATTVQSNVLNDHLHCIESKIDNVGKGLPGMLQTTLWQALGQTQNETRDYQNPVPPRVGPTPLTLRELPNNQAPVPNEAIPSITSTPLLPDNYFTPSPHARNTPQEVVSVLPKFRSTRSDHVIADIVKREQKPIFTGDNMFPPNFLEEVEMFFKLIQVTEDRDKLQIFSTFLMGNPAEWWKLVSDQIDSWDLAKELLLNQYFNDFDRQRYKAEWRNLNCEDFADVEEFTLRGLKILKSIKPKDTDQKRCKRVTIKLPEPLRDYLLNKQFTSTQDFLNKIKEAMLLKNFNAGLYFKTQQINNSNNASSASSGNSYNSKSYNNSQNDNKYNRNNNNNNGYNNNVNNGYNNNNNGYNNNSYNNSNKSYSSNNAYNSNKSNNNFINNNSSSNNQNNNQGNNGNLNNNNNNASQPAQTMNPRFRGNPNNYDHNYQYNGSRRNAVANNANNSSYYYNSHRSPQSGGNQNNSQNSNNSNNSDGKNGNGGRDFSRASGSNNNRNQERRGTNSRGPGVNQVGHAPKTIMPAPSTSVSAPPSPPINHFHFHFAPDTVKGQNLNNFSTAMPSVDNNGTDVNGNEVEPNDPRTEN